MLSLQREVARAIAEQIQARLTPPEQTRLTGTRARPVNPGAYEFYLKGRYYTHRLTSEGIKKANEYFTRAIQVDPGYAPAYAGLADNCVWASFGIIGLPRDEVHAKGREAARRALELDDTLAEGYAARADLTFHFDWDWAAAERGFQRALQLNPSLVTAHESYAWRAPEGHPLH